MTCPRCMNDDVSMVGDTHYVCNRPECVDDKGNRTQFYIVNDEYVRFPHSQIFANRDIDEFSRKPYLELKNPGETKIH